MTPHPYEYQSCTLHICTPALVASPPPPRDYASPCSPPSPASHSASAVACFSPWGLVGDGFYCNRGRHGHGQHG